MALEPSTEETRPFRLGAVLTVTSGRLLATFDDLCRLLEYMSDGPVWTHALPTVGRAMEPVLIERYPWLADVDVPAGLDTEEKAVAFVQKLALIHGEWLEVPKAPEWYRNPQTTVDLLNEITEVRTRAQKEHQP